MNNASPSIDPTCAVTYWKYPYEYDETVEQVRRSLEENWSLPLVSIVIYLVGIYYGQKYMADRKPYNLKWPLFFWNVGLAIFSICGTFRVLAEVQHLLTNFDVYTTVCIVGNCNMRAFWMKMFAMSKIVELGDTAFIILKKRKLIFLHWYHHVSVLLFTWAACAEGAAFGRYFLGVNFAIHSLMYTYFALQTIGIKPAKIISMTITLFQILQMVAGIFVVYYANNELSSGRHCEVRKSTIRNALILYSTYFVLFANFFLQAYIYGGKQKLTDSCGKSNNKFDLNANQMTILTKERFKSD